MYTKLVRQRGFAPVILVLVLALVSVGAAYFYGHKQGKQSSVVQASLSPSSVSVACLQDAMLCPDGSYVGRTGPNCEFVCPEENEINKFARLELSKTLNIPLADITVEKVEEIQWTDGSLGCPEPGKFYTQAIVPGFKVILKVGEKFYYLHSDSSGKSFKICTKS